MARQNGDILIETRAVPNFEAVRKVLRSKTGTDPTPKEMLEHIEGMRNDSQFIPIAYQKIVSVALIHNLDKDRAMAVSCFTGDESMILRNFWLRFEQTKEAMGKHPILVTCDRKRGTLPLLVNRSFALIRAVAVKMIDKHGMLPEEILDKGNIEENPGYRFCAPYRHIRPAMQDFLTNHDKWERDRPNYMNTYSRYTSDLTMEFSLSGIEETDILASEKLVMECRWDTLAKKTVEAALANWKNYATACYIKNNEDFLKESVLDPHLNDPELAEYIITEPVVHPYSLIMPELVASKSTEDILDSMKANVLIRKPHKKNKVKEEQKKEADRPIQQRQKEIGFEER